MINALPEAIRWPAAEAYRAAGGGKDGLAAIDRIQDNYRDDAKAEKVRDKEQKVADQWDQLPRALGVRFPNTTEEEMAALVETAQLADTPEKGIKLAADLRKTQKQEAKKARVTEQIPGLIDGILSNPEWKDVIGVFDDSAIGNFIRMDQGEADAIAMFDLLGDVMTGENLDMMTGVLSESDLQVLRNIGAGLTANRSISEEQMEKALKAMFKATQGASYADYKADQILNR